MSDEAPIIDYEESPLRDEIVIESRDGVLRVITPPDMKFARLSRGYVIAILAVGAIAVMFVLSAITTGEAAFIANAIIYSTVLLAVASAAFIRLRTHYAFQVTESSFVFHRLATGRVMAAWTFRRDKVGPVRVIDGVNLFISIPDGESITARVAHQPDDARRIADALNTALAGHAERIDKSLPQAVDNIEALRPPGSRTRLAAMVGGLGLIVALLIGWHVAREAHDASAGFTAAFYALLFAAAPAGIIFGTQKKEYWQ